VENTVLLLLNLAADDDQSRHSRITSLFSCFCVSPMPVFSPSLPPTSGRIFLMIASHAVSIQPQRVQASCQEAEISSYFLPRVCHQLCFVSRAVSLAVVCQERTCSGRAVFIKPLSCPTSSNFPPSPIYTTVFTFVLQALCHSFKLFFQLQSFSIIDLHTTLFWSQK
jgi:hypothetical protein